MADGETRSEQVLRSPRASQTYSRAVLDNLDNHSTLPPIPVRRGVLHSLGNFFPASHGGCHHLPLIQIHHEHIGAFLDKDTDIRKVGE